MLNQHIVEEVKKRLIYIYKPLEIYLFGSYAWGTPDKESDLGLVIVIKKYSKNRHQMLVDGHAGLADIDISKDILVYSKEEFESFSSDVTRFCYKVKRDGKKIYSAQA